MKKRLNRRASVFFRSIESLESRVLLTATNHLAFLIQPTDTTAGNTLDPAVVVAVEDSSNKIVTSDSSSVTVSIDTGTGPDGASLGGTLTVAASDGRASSPDLALTAAGSGDSAYKLTAKDGSYTSANSNSFAINAAAPSKLAFDGQLSGGKAGTSGTPDVLVDVEDKFGNIVTSDTSAVTLTVATGPSHVAPIKVGKKVSDTPIPTKLGGTVIVNVDGGVASFGDLELDTTGAYTLAATDGKLTSATSNSFSMTAGNATQVAFNAAPAAAVAGATMTTVTAQVEDQFGNVVTTDSSTKITLAIASGPDGSSLGGTLKETVAAGVATFADLSLQTVGSYTISATDGSLTAPTSAVFAITPAAAAKLAFKQAPSNATAGVANSPAVTVMVEDQFGNLVPTDNSKITAAINTGPDGAVLGGPAILAAVKGIATFAGLVLNTAGSYKLGFSDASLTVATSGTFTVAPGAALKLLVKSQPTDTVAGAKISPSVTVDVVDKFGNIVTGDTSTVALALGPGAGSASITGTASVAAVAGVATFDNLKVNTAGAYTFAATDAKLTAAASSKFNVTAGDAAAVVVSALPASVIAGATIPAVKVSVVDALGNVVTGDTSSVTLAIATSTGPDGATLGGTLTEAAVAGVATFSDLSLTASDAGATAYKLKATDGELTAGNTASFDVAASTASQVVFKKGPTDATAGAAISPAVTVQVEDKYGNVVTTDKSNVTLAITTGPSHSAPKLIGKKVSSVPVNASITGTATVAAVNGLATFSNISFNFAGAYTITASDAKLTPAVSSSFTISPGTATQVVFGTGPVAATAGATLAGVTVQVEDAAGNVVTTDTSKVTLAIASGPDGASLGGTLKPSAVAGVATFSDLALQKAGAYTLIATDGSLTSATSASFVISPGAAAKLAGIQAPSTFIAGAAISPAATMAVEDQYGNVVTTDKSKVIASISTGPDGAVLGGVSSATAVAGIATFAGLVLNTAGSYKLAFADGSLTGLSTGTFSVVAAAPAKLAFGQAPSAALAGARQSPTLTVQVEDKFGNVVGGDNSAVMLTIASAPVGGPLGSLATFHASSGIASFSNVAFNVAGNYSIRASDGALVAATSAVFAISPAAASKLVFVQNPSAEVAGVKIGPAVTVQVQDKYGNVVSTDTSGVTVAITDGTNPNDVTLGGTLTQAAAKGVASFGDLMINTSGRYRLTATDGSLSSTVSNAFTVNPSAASQVQFDTQPSDTTAGDTMSNVTVDVEDKFGNLVTTDSKSKVTLALTTPKGGLIGGTLTQTVTGGVATFNDLVPQTAGDFDAHRDGWQAHERCIHQLHCHRRRCDQARLRHRPGRNRCRWRDLQRRHRAG